MTAYERIKALCAERQITIQQLEKETGLSNGTIGRYKKKPDIRPSFKVCQLLSAYFNVDFDYIRVGFTEVEPIPDSVRILDEFESILVETYRSLSAQKKIYLLKYLEELKEQTEE